MVKRRLTIPMVPFFWLSVIFLAGCAAQPARPVQTGAGGQAENCKTFFASLDNQIAEDGAADSGDFRVKDFPYLRVNRFLSSFRKENMDATAFAAWVDHMQALDQADRGYEIANLPATDASWLISTKNKNDLNDRVAACGNLLKAADFHGADSQAEALRKRVAVPDEYSLLRRTLGIYPLFRLFVSMGVDNWHSEAKKTYSPLPPENWSSIRYVPATSGALQTNSRIIAKARRDALGIPSYAPEDVEALFRLHAPAWEVRAQSDQDKIGAPFWKPEGELGVNTETPVTYTLLSFTRFGKDILTQLNYIIWFPSRPLKCPLDIYGGLLDGINYRVTLNANGEPLLYDIIHNCGCFYMAFPAKGLKTRENIDYAEPPLILQPPDIDPAGQFMAIAVESRTHAVVHLYALSRETQPAAAAAYSMADYGQLRSLPRPQGGRAGMFDKNGVGFGTERLERFLLWPTGVLSPGSMRQWGRQAVAFVGTRQFDDPFFMEGIFMEPDF